MKRASHAVNRRRSGWKSIVATIGLVAGMAAMPAAHATPIDFEGIGNDFIFDRDTVYHAGYNFSGAFIGDPSEGGGMVGAVIDGSNSGLCELMTCPYNNASNYLAGLNDGALFMTAATPGASLRLGEFDASFIGSDQEVIPWIAGLLQIRGTRADGSYFDELFELNDPEYGGFAHYQTSDAFRDNEFVELAFFAYSCNHAGLCNAFNSDKGQFGLDNLAMVVPEPATCLSFATGLLLMGALSRRRAV